MKSYLKITTILPLAAMFLAATLAGATPAAAQDFQVKGYFTALETHAVTPPTMAVALEGTGCASHLGFFSLSVDETLFLPTLTSQGTFELEASNGDTLSGTVTGQGTINPANPNEVVIVEQFTITGGTGRFRHATGTFTTHRVLNRTTSVSAGTIDGVIEGANSGQNRE